MYITVYIYKTIKANKTTKFSTSNTFVVLSKNEITKMVINTKNEIFKNLHIVIIIVCVIVWLLFDTKIVVMVRLFMK